MGSPRPDNPRIGAPLDEEWIYCSHCADEHQPPECVRCDSPGCDASTVDPLRLHSKACVDENRGDWLYDQYIDDHVVAPIGYPPNPEDD